MLFISLKVQVVMIIILAKRKVIYTQEQMSMHVVTEKVPFTTISIIVAITATFKIYSVSIMIQ